MSAGAHLPASPLHILIVEYFCAGGGGRRLPPGLLREAHAILSGALADFSALAGVRLLTLRRPGLALHLPAPHEERVVEPARFAAAFRSAVRDADAALVVAPEADGALLRLTRQVEASGVFNLGSTSSAVRTASDKWRTYRALERAGVPQPASILIPARGRLGPRLRERLAGLERGGPGGVAPRGGVGEALQRGVGALSRGPGAGDRWIVKPLDGYACLGIRPVGAGGARGAGRLERGVALSRASLDAARCGARRHTRRARLLLQERRLGADASVSLIGDGRRARAVCLNAQHLRKGERFEYLGSTAPLAHPQAEAALAAARRAARAIRGLRGFFGVDLVLERDGVSVVDVNPRLTTSYLLLRRVTGTNPAALILSAALRGELPRGVRLRGRAEVSIECPTSSAGTSAASI